VTNKYISLAHTPETRFARQSSASYSMLWAPIFSCNLLRFFFTIIALTSAAAVALSSGASAKACQKWAESQDFRSPSVKNLADDKKLLPVVVRSGAPHGQLSQPSLVKGMETEIVIGPFSQLFQIGQAFEQRAPHTPCNFQVFSN
jgi:hypothetical protein